MKRTTITTSGGFAHIEVTEFAGGATDGTGRGRLIPSLWEGADPNAEEVEFTAQQLAPVVPNPRKIFCVGLNFREHIQEMGHPIPDYPTLFAKYASALAGPFHDVHVPEHMASTADYEGELAVIIGPGGTIAGYSIMNDFSQRDWQYRTQQWLQGKNLVRSSGFGPWMVPASTLDPHAESATLRTWVNGELRQNHSLGDLVFPPNQLVDYINNFLPLEPGDVIVTGTPEGVGHGMKPPRYIQDGDEVRIAIDGIGEMSNRFQVGSSS